MFVSASYAGKIWTNHERRSAQARALKENSEYVLPARFDDTEVPGLRDTIGYVDLRKMEPAELADLVAQKLGPQKREAYLPPEPDRLFKALEAESDEERFVVWAKADGLLDMLKRMTPDERHVVFTMFEYGCPAEMPENVHIDLDLLSRSTGFPKAKVLRLLGRLPPLGFDCRRSKERHGDGIPYENDLVRLTWNQMTDGPAGGNNTDVLNAMLHLVWMNFCSAHAQEALARLDFSQLATATATEDVHEEDEEPPPAAASGVGSSADTDPT